MGIVYILLIELSHAPVFECWDKRAVSMVPLHITAAIVAVVFVLAVALHGRQVIFCLLFYRINIRWMIRLNGWQDLISYGNFKHVMKSWIWKPCKVQTGMMNVKIWDGQEFTWFFRRILFNLLPSHVATHFLDNQFRSNMVSKKNQFNY